MVQRWHSVCYYYYHYYWRALEWRECRVPRQDVMCSFFLAVDLCRECGNGWRYELCSQDENVPFPSMSKRIHHDRLRKRRTWVNEFERREGYVWSYPPRLKNGNRFFRKRRNAANDIPSFQWYPILLPYQAITRYNDSFGSSGVTLVLTYNTNNIFTPQWDINLMTFF